MDSFTAIAIVSSATTEVEDVSTTIPVDAENGGSGSNAYCVVA